MNAESGTVAVEVSVVRRCVSSLMQAADCCEAGATTDAVELLHLVANDLEDAAQPPVRGLRLVG